MPSNEFRAIRDRVSRGLNADLVREANGQRYVRRFVSSERLIILGAGHVSQALCTVAALLDFAVTVVDDRPEFANRERFPTAAEVICGINVYEQTGNAENLKEELGDLLLQVVMHAQIAEEEGLFTLDDVVASICSKMVRRHPHVFGDTKVKDSGEVLVNWEEIKAKEKEGKEDVGSFLAKAFDEAEELINRARVRKGFKAGE